MSKNSKITKSNTKKTKKLSANNTPVSGASVSKETLMPVSTPLPSAVTSDLSAAEQKKIQEMITLAQIEYQKIKATVVKEKKREIETLDQQIKEFIGPFMLIGYDLSNNPIEMISASSPAEHDALLERLRRVMFKINQNIANSGGNDPYGFNSN